MSIKVNILLVDGQPGKLLSYEAIMSLVAGVVAEQLDAFDA